MRRVGHKGADLIAPGNTFASFQAALAADVDMIEFDVLPEHLDGAGELWLAHDYEDAGSRTPHTLEEGLAHFADAAYDGIEIDVDMKLPGYERRVIEALRRHDLLDRTLISTMEVMSIDRIRALEPRVRVGLSIPKLRKDPMKRPHTAVLAFAGAAVIRRLGPIRAGRLVRDGRIDALMAHWRLVTPALVRAVHGAGGELYVWTVDEKEDVDLCRELGVGWIATNHPGRTRAWLESKNV